MSHEPYDLNSALANYFDGKLDAKERDELMRRLADMPDGAELLSEWAFLHSRLDLIHTHGAQERSSDAELVGRAPRDKQPQPAERLAREEGKGGSLDESDPPSSAREACPTPRSPTWLQRASRNPKVPSIAVALLVTAAVLITMAVTPVKNWIAQSGKAVPEDRETNKRSEFVAKLSNWKNDKWLEDTRPPLDDPRLKIGRRLKIKSGLIEVTYFTGARVLIEGPAEFTIGSQESGIRGRESADPSRGRKPADVANSGYLALGKLVARVEGKKAQGFTIDTPTVRVEDLGTEFGVKVEESGAATVSVFEGEIVFGAAGDSIYQGERKQLGAGQFARINQAGNLNTGKTPDSEVHFTRVAPWAPHGAYAEAVAASGPIVYARLDYAEGNEAERYPASQGVRPAVAGPGRVLAAPDFPGLPNNRWAEFDGSNAAVLTLPTNLFDSEQGSVTYWLRPVASGSGSQVNLWAGSRSGGMSFDAAGKYLGTLSRTDGSLAFKIENGNNVIGAPARTLKVGHWHHIAATWDRNTGAGDGELRLYVDGVLLASKTDATWTSFVIDGSLRFGKSNTNNNRLFNGASDEVAVFRHALSADEIREQYRAAIKPPPQEDDAPVPQTTPQEANKGELP